MIPNLLSFSLYLIKGRLTEFLLIIRMISAIAIVVIVAAFVFQKQFDEAEWSRWGFRLS